MTRNPNEHFLNTRKVHASRKEFHASPHQDDYRLRKGELQSFSLERIPCPYVVDWQLPREKEWDGIKRF